MSPRERPIVAICGKGGVGKTAVCALLSRSLIEAGVAPLLLVDADPVTGLCQAIGESVKRTLADVRVELIEAARGSDDATRQRLARELDYRVLEVLLERESFALLAMGRTLIRGCFCPVNTLLRHAIDDLAEPFGAVLVDAEAGVEQIQREVTRSVGRTVVVTDGSRRSLHTLEVIVELLGPEGVAVVANRASSTAPETLPAGVRWAGAIPTDAELARFDREGRSLWELPADNPALVAAGNVARNLGLIGEEA